MPSISAITMTTAFGDLTEETGVAVSYTHLIGDGHPNMADHARTVHIHQSDTLPRFHGLDAGAAKLIIDLISFVGLGLSKGKIPLNMAFNSSVAS